MTSVMVKSRLFCCRGSSIPNRESKRRNNRCSSSTTPQSTCMVKLYTGFHGAGYSLGFLAYACDLRAYSNDVASSLRLT